MCCHYLRGPLHPDVIGVQQAPALAPTALTLPTSLAPHLRGLNKRMETRLGMTEGRGLSIKGVVPPQISGFFNRENHQAMRNNGYETATGDNTWVSWLV